MLEGSKERINYLPIIAIIISLILGIIIGYSIKPPSIIRETETKIIKETLPKTEYVLTTITIPTIIPKTIEIEKTIYTATITRVGLTGNLLTTFKGRLSYHGGGEYRSAGNSPPFKPSTEKGKITVILTYEGPDPRFTEIRDLYVILSPYCYITITYGYYGWDIAKNRQVIFEKYFEFPRPLGSYIYVDYLSVKFSIYFKEDVENINFIVNIEEVYP
jgi:hypothetical protein